MSRLARQTENDPIIAACLHNDTPFRNVSEKDRTRERDSYPQKPTKQAAMASGDPRGQPPTVSRPYTWETVDEAEVQIAPPSGLHPANGKPPQWSGGGGAAALTLCYDKYIFLFVLLIWPSLTIPIRKRVIV